MNKFCSLTRCSDFSVGIDAEDDFVVEVAAVDDAVENRGAVSLRLLILRLEHIGQGAQNAVDHFRVREDLRHVRLQHNDVGAFRIAAGILATHAARKIIFLPHFRFVRFVMALLHKFCARADSRVWR